MFPVAIPLAPALPFWPYAYRPFACPVMALGTARAVATLAPFAVNRNPVAPQVRRVRTEAGGRWLGDIFRVRLRALCIVARVVLGERGIPVGAVWQPR